MVPGSPDPRCDDAETCPFLAPVIADRLWVRPLGSYCRRPGQRVRVPAEATLASICSTSAHRECAGYQAAVDASVARRMALGGPG